MGTFVVISVVRSVVFLLINNLPNLLFTFRFNRSIIVAKKAFPEQGKRNGPGQCVPRPFLYAIKRAPDGVILPGLCYVKNRCAQSCSSQVFFKYALWANPYLPLYFTRYQLPALYLQTPTFVPLGSGENEHCLYLVPGPIRTLSGSVFVLTFA